jgi:uncharacterized surface protein with fasciclin (FAS1) repeats
MCHDRLCQLLSGKEKYFMTHIIDTLGDAGIFTSFMLGLQKTGLFEMLSGSDSYTIFAPTDTAFDWLSDEAYASLFDNIHRLISVLQFHIVPGVYTTSHLLDRVFLKTLQGQRLFIRSALSNLSLLEELDEDTGHFIVEGIPSFAMLKSITINTLPITQADVNADNGMIHGLDSVLFPFLIPLG